MKKFKQTAILRIFLFCIASFSIHAQNGHVKCVISYDTKTTNYVRCAKGEEGLLNDFDRIGMRKIEEEDSYTIKILANNDRETTISHIKSNRFPSSAKVAAKTVIDKKGVKTYDKEGNLLTNIPHSPKALESYKVVKSLTEQNVFQNVPEFRRMRNDQMSDLRDRGVKVKSYSDGKIHIRNNNKEVLYDSVNKVVENREFEGKDLSYSLQQKFQTNRSGMTVPMYNREINMKKNERGRRMWHFTEQNIANYNVSIPVQGRSNSESTNSQQEGEFRIYPNPTSKELWVQIPLSIYKESPQIVITDMLGQAVYQSKAQYSLQSINVEKLNVGVYFLQVQSGSGSKLIQRFIKQ